MCHVVSNLIQNHDCRIGFKRWLAVELKITSFAMHTMQILSGNYLVSVCSVTMLVRGT